MGIVLVLIIFGSIIFLYPTEVKEEKPKIKTEKGIYALKQEIESLENKLKLIPKISEIEEFIKSQEAYIESLKTNLGLKIEKMLSKLPVFVVIDIDERDLHQIQNDKMLNLAYKNLATKLFGITEPEIKFVRNYFTSEDFEKITGLNADDYLKYVKSKPIKIINTTGESQRSFFRNFDKVDERMIKNSRK